MLSVLSRLYAYGGGPSLYYLYGAALHRQAQGHPYLPSSLERWTTRLITITHLTLKLSVYCVPLVAIGWWKTNPDMLTMRSLWPLLKLAIAGAAVYSSLYFMRGHSRSLNPDYVQFFETLSAAKRDPRGHFSALRRYDFEFSAWPVDFDCDKLRKFGVFVPVLEERKGVAPANIFVKALGEIAMRTFALKMIYPGSVYLLQLSIAGALEEGRTKLVKEHGGLRHKLKTLDGNAIDTMFVDRRGKSANGSILVVASEGNAGFYEVGIMGTPIEAGYSVLGWNHPGFAGSEGRPLPDQEHRAMDAVMQFAISGLGFDPKNIVLFGWSIGAYSTAWAAVQYPDVRAVVVDASFDDILPLALSKMPPSWEGLVTEVVGRRADLRIAEILEGYSGPIRFIRRTADEIICLEDGKIATNRGNDLLLQILRRRYPRTFDEEGLRFARRYLGARGPALVSLLRESSTDVTRRVLILINEYLTDYQSTHCTPLPPDLFRIPEAVNVLE